MSAPPAHALQQVPTPQQALDTPAKRVKVLMEKNGAQKTAASQAPAAALTDTDATHKPEEKPKKHKKEKKHKKDKQDKITQGKEEQQAQAAGEAAPESQAQPAATESAVTQPPAQTAAPPSGPPGQGGAKDKKSKKEKTEKKEKKEKEKKEKRGKKEKKEKREEQTQNQQPVASAPPHPPVTADTMPDTVKDTQSLPPPPTIPADTPTIPADTQELAVAKRPASDTSTKTNSEKAAKKPKTATPSTSSASPQSDPTTATPAASATEASPESDLEPVDLDDPFSDLSSDDGQELSDEEKTRMRDATVPLPAGWPWGKVSENLGLERAKAIKAHPKFQEWWKFYSGNENYSSFSSGPGWVDVMVDELTYWDNFLAKTTATPAPTTTTQPAPAQQPPSQPSQPGFEKIGTLDGTT